MFSALYRLQVKWRCDTIHNLISCSAWKKIAPIFNIRIVQTVEHLDDYRWCERIWGCNKTLCLNRNPFLCFCSIMSSFSANGMFLAIQRENGLTAWWMEKLISSHCSIVKASNWAPWLGAFVLRFTQMKFSLHIQAMGYSEIQTSRSLKMWSAAVTGGLRLCERSSLSSPSPTPLQSSRGCLDWERGSERELELAHTVTC